MYFCERIHENAKIDPGEGREELGGIQNKLNSKRLQPRPRILSIHESKTGNNPSAAQLHCCKRLCKKNVWKAQHAS